jgi:hypothetical protein
LRCAECGADADGKARGCRALIGEEDDGGLMVAVFCSECAKQEFGDDANAA